MSAMHTQPAVNHRLQPAPVEAKGGEKIGICVTFHGRQRKSRGSMAPEVQAYMLEQSLERLLGEETFPVILSGILASPSEFPAGPARETMLRLWSRHHWISTTEDYDHQSGAMQTILNGFEAAVALGIEWLFVTAEDVLFDARNPVREIYDRVRKAGVDYYSRCWLDDVGIEAVGTQVFLCRVRSLFDPARQWLPWQPEFFNGYRGLEHYTVQTLINHGIPYERDAQFTYHHTHDRGEFQEILERLRRMEVKPPAPPPAKKVLLRFRHGLGDAMQFTAVLRHLRARRPETEFEVASLRGKHTAFTGLAHRTWVLGEEKGDYAETHDIRWAENLAAYEDTVNTKATLCLRQVFGLEPERELLRYRIEIPERCTEAARAYLRSLGCGEEGGRFRAVALHYQGNTAQEKKNLDHDVMRGVCASLVAGGYTPIILDWDRRSPLPDGKEIFCPDAKHPLWENAGTGDAAQIAALLEHCMAFVGIDSGPLHVAAALSVPALGVWTRHLPIRYIEPAENILHLVPSAWRGMTPCDQPRIAELQAYWYALAEYDSLKEGATIVRHLHEHCGLQLTFAPWRGKLKSVTFDQAYYEEHRAAGLDYLAFGAWQRGYAAWLRAGFGLEGRRVLDVGCACGSVVRALADVAGASHGIDVNGYVLQLGRQKWPELASRLVEASAEKLPMFAAGAFDFLHSSQVAEHWPPEAVPAILAELRRVLQPGGLFFCSMDTVESYQREQRLLENEDPTHFCVRPLAFWHEALVAAGWAVVTAEHDAALRALPDSYLQRYQWDYFVARNPAQI